MIEYRFAAPEHRADLIDFINYVFSQNSVPHDFKTLIPKVYADGRGLYPHPQDGGRGAEREDRPAHLFRG